MLGNNLGFSSRRTALKIGFAAIAAAGIGGTAAHVGGIVSAEDTAVVARSCARALFRDRADRQEAVAECPRAGIQPFGDKIEVGSTLKDRFSWTFEH